MKIKLHQIKVRDVWDGYKDFGEDNGIVGYHDELNIRPPYQRNFVYNPDQERAVMNTVLHGFPLNIMYWVIDKDGGYEILDGQQRTLSIMRFLNHQYSINWNGQTVYEDSLPNDVYNQLLDYEFMVYWCQGTDSEKLDWFRTVNIAGVKLTAQELRNIAYTGAWLSDAKRYFSKRNCAAKKLADGYVKGDPNRQEILELALKWISSNQGISIDDYMAKHRSDSDADELWQHWQDVIRWIQKIFPRYDKHMKGLPWGDFYNEYSDKKFNATEMDREIDKLLDDDEIKSKSGIWHYELAKHSEEPNATRYLHLRTFSSVDKRRKWKEQEGVCPMCKAEGVDRVWKLNEMEGDHIIPWSKGGKTEYDNLQMLCKPHNESKGNR